MASIYIPDDRDLYSKHKTLTCILSKELKPTRAQPPPYLEVSMQHCWLYHSIVPTTLAHFPLSKIPQLPKSLQLMRYGKRQFWALTGSWKSVHVTIRHWHCHCVPSCSSQCNNQPVWRQYSVSPSPPSEDKWLYYTTDHQIKRDWDLQNAVWHGTFSQDDV